MSGAFASRVLGLVSVLMFAQVAAGEDVSARDVPSLVRIANGSDPAGRVSATRELFRRGKKILSELAAAGARPMADLSPRRSDVIFTLMRGLSGAELGSDLGFASREIDHHRRHPENGSATRISVGE
jgi:hypothetical protein